MAQGGSTERSDLRTIKEAQTNLSLDEQLRQFKNLRSSLYQWIAAQELLETSHAEQKQAAESEIFERYLQVKQLREQNCEMRNLI